MSKGHLPYRSRHLGFDPASFCRTLAANVENERLSDADFRDFVRNSIAGQTAPDKARPSG